MILRSPEQRLLDADLGRRNEDRVLRAIRTLAPQLWWILGVGRATHEEDRRGIDLVVRTRDTGNLHLQVKSSVAGARQWLLRYGAERIGLVIVQRGDCDAVVAGKALGALILLREEMGK